MSVMILLLGVSITVGIIFLFAFIWSVKNGQMDDTFSPAHKILFDDMQNQSKTTDSPSEHPKSSSN